MSAIDDSLKAVLKDLISERNRQEWLKTTGKFPFTCADAGVTDIERLPILVEEIGEVARAMLDREGDEQLYEELIQCAAVCAAWATAVARRKARP